MLHFLIAGFDLAGQAHPPKPEQGRGLGEAAAARAAHL